MNQEPNNLNPNNINGQNNEGVSNSEPVNNTYQEQTIQPTQVQTIQPTPTVNQNVETNYPQPMNQPYVQPVSNNLTPEPSKKNIKLFIIIGVIILIIIVGVILCIVLSQNKAESNNKSDTNVNENNNNSNNQPEELSENTFTKLKKDFDSGKIDANKYFTELFYYEYDSSKLDNNYKTDEKYYTPGCQSELLELLQSHKDELDKDIIKEYVEKVTLHNVSLGNSSNVQTKSNVNPEYEVKLLDNEEEKENAKNHRLDKVKLSKNGNFLIWYTNNGSDAITEEQLQQISNELENTIFKYEETFGVKYSYFPYQDSILNDDYKNAKEVLKSNNIPVNTINTAMSVYIYDTGSEGVLASYFQPYGVNILLDFIVQLGLKDDDGIVTFPYIVINKQGFSDEDESLKQLYTHELFHHFQYLFCRSSSGNRCVAGNYSEGTANMAGAIAGNVSTTNNFLNGWASAYTKNVSTTLSEITDGASYGYGTFPYLYVYSETVNNWASTIMNAHNETNPFEYIKNHTSREDLVKISEKLTYGLLAKNFDNKAMYSSKDVTIKETLTKPKKISETINPGAIVYYEVSGDNTLTATSGSNEYVGLKFYGYKDGVYTELLSNMTQIDADLTYYARYDKFYLAIYNADITNSNTYTIELKGSNFAENSEFVTTFNNYNIEIEMEMTVSGITTNTISKGVVDEKHQKEYLDTTTSMAGISLNNKIYSDFNTGYSYTTQPYGGDAWWKDKSATQTVDLGSILDKLISMKNVTKIDANHYKVKMTKDDIAGLMNSGDANSSIISGDIDVEVYTENGYITRLDYDFSKIMKGIEKYTTTIKFSNYDKAGDVEIPQSIIDNAKTQ